MCATLKQYNMASSLKQQTISGMIWSATQRFGTMGISLISNLVLARLLTPEDYGCIGLLAIFIVVSGVFINGGFAGALVQKKEPTNEDYSTVFYWNTFISISAYIILYLASPYIASFYNIPLLESVLQLQGIILIINAFGSVQQNKFRKELKFKTLSVIQIISSSISVIVAITMAYYGWGVWSLVAQQLLNSFIAVLLLWFTSNWRPTLCFSLKSFKELFAYGSFLLLSDLLNEICSNIQGLIIGRKYSVSDMGFYSQAKKMEEIPTTTISYVVSTVTFPVFSKLQNNKEQLHTAVRKCLRLMNFMNFPLMILLIVVAEPLFIILFSDKWIGSVPYFRILCIAGLVNCLQSVNYQVTAAVGRSKAIFKWNVVKRFVGLSLIFIGMNWGVEGILWGVVAGFYFTFLVNAIVATSSTGYSLLQQTKDAIPLLLISIVSAMCAYPIVYICDFSNIVLLIVQTLIFIAMYLSVSKILRLTEYDEFIKIIKPYINKIR